LEDLEPPSSFVTWPLPLLFDAGGGDIDIRERGIGGDIERRLSLSIDCDRGRLSSSLSDRGSRCGVTAGAAAAAERNGGTGIGAGAGIAVNAGISRDGPNASSKLS